MNQADALFCQQ